MNVELILDTVLYNDGASFDNLTWSRAHEKTTQKLFLKKEIQECPSDGERLIKRKSSCYFGICQLVSTNGKLNGVTLKKNNLSFIY